MLHISQRQRVYAFFVQLFNYPDDELLQTLQSDDPAEIGQLLAAAPPTLVNLTVTGLQETYTGLFISRLGGVPAPPYGSVYLDEGTLMGASTLRVAEAYREAGLVINASSEPPDFLATELEYLYFLVGREEEGFKSRDVTAARQATGRQLAFLNDLLLPWLAIFVERLEKAGVDPLYLWGAQRLLAFVRDEQAWLARLN